MTNPELVVALHKSLHNTIDTLLEVYANGVTATPIATATLTSGSLSVTATGLTGAYNADASLSVGLRKAASTHKSDFKYMQATVELTETS